MDLVCSLLANSYIMPLIKKMYGAGVTFLKWTFRRDPLKDDRVIQLLRSAHISGLMGESFETFLKSITKK